MPSSEVRQPTRVRWVSNQNGNVKQISVCVKPSSKQIDISDRINELGCLSVRVKSLYHVNPICANRGVIWLNNMTIEISEGFVSFLDG